jgi:hypothetical protein
MMENVRAVRSVVIANLALLVAACGGSQADLPSCFAVDVSSGARSPGRCQLDGYLVSSERTALIMENYSPQNVPNCLMTDCLSLSIEVTSFVRIPYQACSPTRISGVAEYRILADGILLVHQIDPDLAPETIACEFPPGFFRISEQ